MADKPLFPKSKPRKGKGGKHHLLLYGLLAVAAAGGIWLYTRNQQQKKTATASPTTAATGAYSTSPAVGTLASQVPQFVNQTYVNPTPPQVTQTTNITNNPPHPPPPPHRKTGDDPDKDKIRNGSHMTHGGKITPLPKFTPGGQVQPQRIPRQPGQPKVAF